MEEAGNGTLWGQVPTIDQIGSVVGFTPQELDSGDTFLIFYFIHSLFISYYSPTSFPFSFCI